MPSERPGIESVRWTFDEFEVRRLIGFIWRYLTMKYRLVLLLILTALYSGCTKTENTTVARWNVDGKVYESNLPIRMFPDAFDGGVPGIGYQNGNCRIELFFVEEPREAGSYAIRYDTTTGFPRDGEIKVVVYDTRSPGAEKYSSKGLEEKWAEVTVDNGNTTIVIPEVTLENGDGTSTVKVSGKFNL
jgi:hypothetical protein